MGKIYRGLAESIPKIASTSINKVYRGATTLWENWVLKTGTLWQTVSTLGSWGYSINVDTGIKTVPIAVKPTRITLQAIGGQQDSSSQQMTRTIVGYRKADNVAVTLFTITSALGPTFNTTGVATLDGTIEYNRITGSLSGKVTGGSSLTLKVTDWWEKG
jgi:hypothetical protein